MGGGLELHYQSYMPGTTSWPQTSEKYELFQFWQTCVNNIWSTLNWLDVDCPLSAVRRSDTTTVMSVWCFASHWTIGVLEKAQEELDEKVGRERRAVRETLRLYFPGVHLGLPCPGRHLADSESMEVAPWSTRLGWVLVGVQAWEISESAQRCGH